ncbi:type III secretion system needle filament subunit SctF [Symbiopectobacterium purcellii]|uniref:type III secretion system needle filament subunit SctF n=1 Tax=Symbiopectobacterium purcellii TaxID=2871826 RepID=UPI003F85C28A
MAKYTPVHLESIFIDKMSGDFEAGANTLMKALNKSRKALRADSSNPAVLAEFQSKLHAYTLFRNAQTSVIKAYKDVGAAIIQNFR